jgi:cytoskeleton protein RodZ
VSDSEVGLGSLLVESREQAGLSQDDVAKDLHLDLQVIKALESDAFDELPEPTYVRGYIRSYARLLSLTPEDLLAIYDQQDHNEPEWEINEPAKHEVAQGRQFRHITLVVALVIIGLLITWLLTEGNGHKDEVQKEDMVVTSSAEPVEINPQSEITSPKEQPEPLAPLAVDEPVDTAPATEESVVVAEQADVAIEEPVTEQEPVEDALPVADDESQSLGDFSLAGVVAEGQDQVKLTFSNDSWVEIVDSNGVQVLRGLFKKGTVRELVGSAPFSVFLGNTQGVAIEINNQSFDPAPFTRRDSTSRFTLKAQ